MFRLVSAILAGLLAVAAPARATVVAPLDLDGLVAHADRVALVEVESQAAKWSADRSAIYTDVTVRVLAPVKGALAAGDRVVIRHEGGEVGTIGMRVSGAARFAVGEQAVVFLEQRGAAAWTVGMAQGKLRVATVGGRRVAVRDTVGLAFSRPPPSEPAVRPLDELLADLAARVRAAGAR